MFRIFMSVLLHFHTFLCIKDLSSLFAIKLHFLIIRTFPLFYVDIPCPHAQLLLYKKPKLVFKDIKPDENSGRINGYDAFVSDDTLLLESDSWRSSKKSVAEVGYNEKTIRVYDAPLPKITTKTVFRMSFASRSSDQLSI